MPAIRDDALAILLRLREAGYTAYFAGGCVRDLLLGLEAKDYDVATNAPPGKVRELFSNTQAVGAAFGVILVHHHRSVVEVATFRSEGPYTDGRHPDAVKFATPQEDAARRDFTINGLFLDPVTNRVIDYVGGQKDLEAKVLRAIGEAEHRFEEDHLRMLRAVRFASRFGFSIDAKTAQAIVHHAPRIKRISPERIADEMRRMLTVSSRSIAWRMLRELALLPELFRHLTPTPVLKYPVVSAIDASEITFGFALAGACVECVLDSADVRPLLAASSMQKIVRACRQSFRISNEESEDLAHTLKNLSPMLADEPPTLARKKRFLAAPSADNTLVLMQTLSKLGLHRERIDALLPELVQLSTTEYAPLPLITGDDLTAAGMQPGPEFKRILDCVYDAQLEGKISSKEEGMKMAMRNRSEC